MRIAIFTLPLQSNYGGIIQAYALQTVLERMGHQVVVLNKPCLLQRLARRRWLPAYAKRIVKKLIIDHDLPISREKEWNLIHKHTDRFIRQYIHNRWITDLGDFREDEVDAIVVGSDQIWCPKYFVYWSHNLAHAFLYFAKDLDVKRWAYGVSFGVDSWDFPQEQTPLYARLMQQFLAVSVREDTGVTLCREHLKVEAQHVLDPTLLLTAQDYQTLIDAYEKTDSPLSSPDSPLTAYLLDPNPKKIALMERVAHERGLTPRRVGSKTSGSRFAHLSARLVPPMEEWLRGFAEAGMVLTDSFHGCVFSIIFRKPFIVLGNEKRGLSRMQSLVRLFHLEDHLLLSPDDYDPARAYNLPATLDTTYDFLRRRSFDFLEKIKDEG